MPQIVPLQAVPSQIVSVGLGDQVCQIKVYQKFYGLFVDLYVDDSLIIAGVIGENLNRIVRSAYLGFEGDLCFFDFEGAEDPRYEGLGTRFALVYLTQAELDGAG